eukprot:scaffold5364_cov164-Amphora_coffeaeformis.AAC.8
MYSPGFLDSSDPDETTDSSGESLKVEESDLALHICAWRPHITDHRQSLWEFQRPLVDNPIVKSSTPGWIRRRRNCCWTDPHVPLMKAWHGRRCDLRYYLAGMDWTKAVLQWNVSVAWMAMLGCRCCWTRRLRRRERMRCSDHTCNGYYQK